MNAHTSVGPLDRAARVYIAGHRGLVGSALLRTFAGAGFTNLLVRSRAELDLTDRAATFDFVLESRPQVVIDAAARVGGILANDTYPADFLSENLQIQVNLLDAAVAARVPRLLFLGSSCICETRPAADPGERAAHRSVGADQRRVRDRQNRRHPCGPGGAPPTWPAVDLGDAHQPVRARRQLFAVRLASAAGTHPPL